MKTQQTEGVERMRRWLRAQGKRDSEYVFDKETTRRDCVQITKEGRNTKGVSDSNSAVKWTLKFFL